MKLNMQMKKKEILNNNRAVTLIALIITMVILLILAGITIASLSGENGLFSRVKQAKRAQIESKMKEKLNLAIQDLQVEKLAEATLDDITQEWADNKLKEYNPKITDDASINGKKITMSKDQLTGRYIIDENLNIVEQEKTAGAVLTYEVKSREGENLQVEVVITDDENGLQTIEYNDGLVQHANGLKRVSRDCTIQLGVEYKVKIVSKSGEEKTETILINDYYHKITKELGEGISIDNVAVKTAYNKPYQAIITAEDNYIVTDLLVTMDGKAVTTSGNDIVDINTGKIYIENVTGDINIVAKSKKLEIQYQAVAISTNNSANNMNSLEENTQTKGTKLYINIIATLEGNKCTIVLKDDESKTVPYEVSQNGKYTFIVSGIYSNKTIREEKIVTVNQYKMAQNLVQYDAGDWTQEEIEELKNQKLYDLNASNSVNEVFKLNDDRGVNFTFGGFTYKNDKNNESIINKGTIITSRNQSVSSKNAGTPNYSGWQILEIKDSNGNVISNEEEINKKINNLENEKIYVTKIVHAGSPENFVYAYYAGPDNQRCEYLLSGGTRQKEYSILEKTGNKINPRNYQMYIDKKQKDLIADTVDKDGNTIKNIHLMTYEEASKIEISNGIRKIGSYYLLATAATSVSEYYFWVVEGDTGDIKMNYGFCYGIRPVVEMQDGVYIKSGDGTESSPYVLEK